MHEYAGSYDRQANQYQTSNATKIISKPFLFTLYLQTLFALSISLVHFGSYDRWVSYTKHQMRRKPSANSLLCLLYHKTLFALFILLVHLGVTL
jgi:hypothetical protein